VVATTAWNGAKKSLNTDRYERALATVAVILLSLVIAALARGHLATILIALILTPVILLGRRGTSLHRLLGWIWASSMVLTALLSLFVRTINPGHFSLIHLLSVFTLLQVPLIVVSARSHNVPRHRRSVRAMVTGALLIAGFFTFPFNRLLGHWLFG
jgi:uncharacterized membrane protein